MIDLIFALAEVLIISSFILRDMLYLRIITSFGLATYLIGGILAGLQTSGMKALILFNAIGLIINSCQIYKLITDKIPIAMPATIKAIYKETFSMLTVSQFLKILKLSTTEQFQHGIFLTHQHQPVNDLFLIKDGSVNIIIDDHVVTEIGAGYFVGEMSFLSGNTATASVQVTSQVLEIMTWSKPVLEKLDRKDPFLYNQLNLAIAVNLIKKVHHQAQTTKISN